MQTNEGEARLLAYSRGKELEALYEKVADLENKTKIIEIQQNELIHLRKACWLFAKAIQDLACIGTIDDYMIELEEIANSEQ